jgi:hypothetical protein
MLRPGGKSMPYRRAYIWLLLLFPLTALAFWPAYFSKLTTSSVAFHVHGITASLWIAMLAFQSWSIHRGRNAQHRLVGWSSLGLFPLFFGGGLLIIHSMAAKFGAQADPFYSQFGARLGIIDTVASAGIAWLYVEGLRQRRKAQLHARYMIATVFFLWSPIIGRLLPVLPPLAITGPDDLYRFAWSVQVANGLAVALTMALWFAAPRHGRAWLITAGAIVLQIILFETIGRSAAWETLFKEIAAIPAAIMFASGLAAGSGLAWLGWTLGPARRPPAVQAA